MIKTSFTFCRHGNFGDKLNLSLSSSLGIKSHRHAFGERIEDDLSVLGIGTILTGRLIVSSSTKLVVFGSGYGVSQKLPSLPKQFGEELPKNLDIRFVRGPLSCEALRLSKSKYLSDSAYLFGSKFRELTASVKKVHAVGFIPHWQSPLFLPQIWSNEKVAPLVIDPMLPLLDFVREVASCDKIVTEALHGAILADMLRIPFAIVQTSPFFDSFKWLDWLSSVRLPFVVNYLCSAEDVCDFKYTLSDSQVLSSIEASIYSEFLRLREDIYAHWSAGS